jgi:hypothetical protein
LDRHNAFTDFVHAIREYRRLADSTPSTLQGSDYALAVQELNRTIEQAEALCSMISDLMPCKIGSQKDWTKADEVGLVNFPVARWCPKFCSCGTLKTWMHRDR